MASRDGNGWIRCSQGHRHWGRFGAAGLLAYAGPNGDLQVLLQRRTWWSHHGGTWGLPGGAADSHETPVAAALREAQEECQVPADAVTVRGIFLDDHGGWAYRTVFASAPAPFRVLPGSDETDEVAWVGAGRAGQLDLHPGLAAHWAALREGLAPVTVIVDAANVIGSRPDGWWRDRPGAARRLVAALATLAEQGVPGFPAELRRAAPAQWFPDIVVVLEGQARSALADETLAAQSRLRVVGAPGSGDDLIAALAGQTPGQRLVVTADRALRSRCEAAGAQVTGPSWLTGLLDARRP
jgi:8-oxo-dGTP pyrophosphatase MutT (NUDIX family)